MKRALIYAQTQLDYDTLKEYLIKGWVLDPALTDGKPYRLENNTVWPLILYESEEEKPKPEMKQGEFDSVIDVVDSPHAEVKDWVAKGYVVHAIYATKTILVKCKEKSI